MKSIRSSVTDETHAWLEDRAIDEDRPLASVVRRLLERAHREDLRQTGTA